MDQTTEIVMDIIWGALYLSPVIGLVVYLFTRKKPVEDSKRYAIIITIPIMLLLMLYFTDLTFTSIIYSAALLALSYLSYCLLYFTGIRLKQKALRYTILILGILPIAAGYMLSTIGAPGLALMIEEEIPMGTIVINEDYNTKLYCSGVPEIEGSGVIAKINKHPLSIGFLENQLFRLKFYYKDYDNLDQLNVVQTKDATGRNIFTISAGSQKIATCIE